MVLLLGLHNLGGIREFQRKERVFKTGAATEVKTWRQEFAGLCRGQRGKGFDWKTCWEKGNGK